MKNILVLGGKGKTGRKVAEHLTAMNYNVRIGSRSETPAFDWDDQSTWAAALEGMDAVYITYQPDLAVPGAKEAIEGFLKQAKASGIKKAVLLSGKGEAEAEQCEQILMDSGIAWTVVRASWFNQNFSEGFFVDSIEAGIVAMPVLNYKVPFVDTDDIGAVAAKALVEEGHNGEIYELTGAELLDFKEAVAIISEASGREIQTQDISNEEYNHMLKELQVPEDYIWLINYLFEVVLTNPDNQQVTADIRKVLGREPRSFREYALETFAGKPLTV